MTQRHTNTWNMKPYTRLCVWGIESVFYLWWWVRRVWWWWWSSREVSTRVSSSRNPWLKNTTIITQRLHGSCICVRESSRCRKIQFLHESLMSLSACVRSSMLKSWEIKEKSMRIADKEPRCSWAGTGVVFLSPMGGGACRGVASGLYSGSGWRAGIYWGLEERRWLETTHFKRFFYLFSSSFLLFTVLCTQAM